VPVLPPDVFAWDDAGNNKWLVAGKGALIMNPPSAWAVAKRDAPQIAEQLWTFAHPKGPKGRYASFLPYYYCTWKFSKNQSAAKSLIMHLSQRASVERLVNGSSGYDIPAFSKQHDFKVWLEEGPPKGTIYHYPPRGDQLTSVAGAPASPTIANQIYTQATMTKMVAQCTVGGKTIEQAIIWATRELEGYMRT
jgi:ABC-type glycerol-3-phosphate transport system substrate-binding protein